MQIRREYNIYSLLCRLGESIGGGLVIAYTAWPTKWMVLIGSFLSTIGAGLQSINGMMFIAVVFVFVVVIVIFKSRIKY
jgi:hypothetical protein